MKLAYNKLSPKKYLVSLFNYFILKVLIANSIKHSEKKSMGIFSKDYIGFNIILNGIYELDYLNLFVKFFEENSIELHNMNVLDIGANIGNHTVYFSKYFKSVTSFEPNPKVFKMLDLNTFELANVDIFNYGLSNSEGEHEFTYTESNFGGGSLITKDFENKVSINIKLKKLDDIHFDNKIDLIKIDIEGHEYNAFLGGGDLLLKDKPYILFEQNMVEIENGTTKSIELLKTFNYKNFYTIETKKYASNKLINFLFKLFLGVKFEIKHNHRLEKRNYSFIIAGK